MDIPHCLSIHQLMNIWVISTIWLLCILLVYRFMYKVLCGMHTGFLVLWGIPRSEIDGSEDNSVYLSEELLNCLVSASFYNPTSNVRVPISPYPHQQLLLPLFLTIAIPVCVKWYLIVILICISLMTNDTEHLFMCLLAIYISSLERCLFRSFPHFFIGLVLSLLL